MSAASPIFLRPTPSWRDVRQLDAPTCAVGASAATLAVTQPTLDIFDGPGWARRLERRYMATHPLTAEGYAPKEVLEALTNRRFVETETKDTSAVWRVLLAYRGQPMVACSKAATLSFLGRLWHALLGLFGIQVAMFVPHHGYAILDCGVDPELGRCVTLYNPQGHTEGRADGPNDGWFRVPLATFTAAMSAIVHPE